MRIIQCMYNEKSSVYCMPIIFALTVTCEQAISKPRKGFLTISQTWGT